ncbi:MarR family winged helix-turn-helix transcriptional regulator [Mobilicoccus massiliensis]|uniref:MarR family winged helix-turn-helix transcriptional regulator n=1 Tax=Mobilicoccus massiliensis TaxID=1522310 RepID=UPI0009E27AF7|nr:MarR family transcriptional regulator [Mobilicoccus massiliensis]
MTAEGPDDRGSGTAVPHDSVAWFSEDEQRAWRAYLAASRLLDDAMDDDVQKHGLQLSEYEILALLSESEERHLRMSALADSVVQSRSRLTHTASRLEKRGLVQRRPAFDDRRGVELWLTDAGLELVEQVAPSHVESVRRHLIEHLGAERFLRLGESMAMIRDGIQAEHTSAPGGPDPDAPAPAH